ncbi:putative phosphatidate phosphatase-like protein, partial [Dinothrombium tinctorium]
IILVEALQDYFVALNRTIDLKHICRKIYSKIVAFVFGALICKLITDIVKYNVGRLRPHFWAIC